MLLLADVESILISKARMAPAKNRQLLTEYLALGPSDRFLELAQKYDIDLEKFV